MAQEQFDIESLTWGELGMVEEASGLSIAQLTKRLSYLQALATMVLASRNGEPVPSWQSLMNRRVLDASSSPLRRTVDSPSEKSSDSE